MVGERPIPPPKEPATPEEEIEQIYDTEHIAREAEVLQEEVIASMPPLAHFLLKKQYDLKYFYKIPVAILIILAIYFLVGPDALITGAFMFALWFIVGYVTQSRHLEKDKTYFFETKKRGQLIRKEYSPYSRDFIVEEDRTALWAVPTRLIQKGLFRIPGDIISPLPANPGIIFVDFFDPQNRTCVLPAHPDVANICLDANMNPSLAKTFDEIADQLDRIDLMQQKIMMQLNLNMISREQAMKMMKELLKTRQKVTEAAKKVKRDIFQQLQLQIPVLQDTVRYLKGKMYSLADSIAAELIYELLNRPIPSHIERNINLIRESVGAPKVGEYRKLIREIVGGGR